MNARRSGKLRDKSLTLTTRSSAVGGDEAVRHSHACFQPPACSERGPAAWSPRVAFEVEHEHAGARRMPGCCVQKTTPLSQPEPKMVTCTPNRRFRASHAVF